MMTQMTQMTLKVFRPCLASDCLRQMSIRDIPRLKISSEIL